MRHPEKGEVQAAADMMNGRMRAVADDVPENETFDIGGKVYINRLTGEATGMPLGVLAVYGDLFDVGEMTLSALSVCNLFLADIATGRRDPIEALVSLYLQAAGKGVLIERARWERGDA